MKNILITIGIILWALGGGMIITAFVFGVPFMVIGLSVIKTLNWIWNYIPHIIIFLIVSLLLIYGFTEKVDNPLH